MTSGYAVCLRTTQDQQTDMEMFFTRSITSATLNNSCLFQQSYKNNFYGQSAELLDVTTCGTPRFKIRVLAVLYDVTHYYAYLSLMLRILEYLHLCKQTCSLCKNVAGMRYRVRQADERGGGNDER